MRLILVLMLVSAGVLGAIGFPMAFAGSSHLLGASMASLSLATAWYAFRKGNEEAEHQRAYDLSVRVRIDSLTAEATKRST